MRPKILIVAAVATSLLVLVVAALLWYLGSAGRDREGQVRLARLRGPVEVWRDSLGVPHVWASSLEDLLFAQGYTHAQDRLWQMELLRRVAEGRLAELFGERALDSDRFLRTLGLWRAAGVNERRLTAEERRRVEAYAAGVNAWISGRRGALPPEFLLLRIQPEPWRVRHSLAIEKVMAWDLSLYSLQSNLAHAVRQLGPQKAAFLLPDYPAWGATILPGPRPPQIPPLAAAMLDAASLARASNSWVIASSRTRSGKPILANDMHLALRAPSLWYLMALHGDGIDVAGMTIPGTPFVIAGHNRAIAWGYTNAMVDDVDFFLERVDPADPSRYLVPGGSLPFQEAAETIRVKGRSAPVVERLRLTRHGPLLDRVEERSDSELLALRWIAHDSSDTFRAMEALNRASDWQEFLRALEDFDNPHQNVIYADTAGHIGYIMGGRVPLRGAGKTPPLLPVPGWTGAWDWNGELGLERHPRVLDPPQGYIVTANNRQAPSGVAELISTYWMEPFRALRITELVEEGGPHDAAAAHGMQLDVRDALAVRYRAHAVEAAERAGLVAAAELLREWDARADAGSRAAALFYVWYERLGLAAARSLYGKDGGWFPREAVNGILEQAALPWVVEDGAARFRELAARAMGEADSIARGKKWGELHLVVAEHPLGSLRGLGRFFNVGPVPQGGSPTTVNVSHYDGSRFPVRASYGPSQRHVVDMADVDGAGGFLIPTGQSGLPFSRHYRDQFARWRQGGLWRIPLEREQARSRVVQRLVLEPLKPE
ncbi:MAG: penicillin acylase family protein [Gemmatimonadetes bacterium]|nr:penicillin acylase family protein [Gemmatimonadota bacterium]